jgi:hypothetical protein
MAKTYTLELKFVLTDEQRTEVVEAARRLYAAGPPSTAYYGDIPHELTPEEFIDGPGSALHLLDQNTVLETLDISSAIRSDPGEYSPVDKAIIKNAVERERTRLWNGNTEGVPAKTELGKRIQESMRRPDRLPTTTSRSPQNASWNQMRAKTVSRIDAKAGSVWEAELGSRLSMRHLTRAFSD